jgi:hypothetical protein
MMEITIRADFGQILGMYAGLAVFGIVYNRLIAWMEKKGYIEGFTSLMVAVGVLVTLAPIVVFSAHLALAVLGGFIASGSPMIVGSIVRYARARERAREEIARLNCYGNEPQRLAE